MCIERPSVDESVCLIGMRGEVGWGDQKMRFVLTMLSLAMVYRSPSISRVPLRVGYLP